jgi:glucose/arabinose dehydrogenase
VDLYLPLLSFVKFVSFRCHLLLPFGLSVVIIFFPTQLVAVASNDITFNHDGYSEELRLESEVVFSGLEFPTAMAFLGPEDILVLEQGKGTVQRILHGEIMDEPVLDVNVVNERDKYGWKEERGLLGIAVADDAGDSSTFRYVFLYYTEAEGEDGGDPIGNRLYRYELINNKLVNPRLLLDLPVDKNNPAHNGGAVAIGPDENIYIIVGNLVGPGLSDDVEESLDQNIQDGKDPDGRGGILRVTQDGEVVDNEGILGDNHPLDKYYAYGIRNSFGIAFDPITGNLWDTENGPTYGDEINLIDPGFNSGWAKILGVWSVEEATNEEGTRDVNKGQKIASQGTESRLRFLSNLENFGGHGNYSDPELTWERSIGPTSITFLDSDRLGKDLENDLFVANVEGQIYHFELSANRTQLQLGGPLSDKIAQNPDEMQSTTFGSQFGIITDMEVGPDGFLYVLTGVRDVEGKIYRLSSTLEVG